jgi:hypothetical protein
MALHDDDPMSRLPVQTGFGLAKSIGVGQLALIIRGVVVSQ